MTLPRKGLQINVILELLFRIEKSVSKGKVISLQRTIFSNSGNSNPSTSGTRLICTPNDVA